VIGNLDYHRWSNPLGKAKEDHTLGLGWHSTKSKNKSAAIEKVQISEWLRRFEEVTGHDGKVGENGVDGIKDRVYRDFDGADRDSVLHFFGADNRLDGAGSK